MNIRLGALVRACAALVAHQAGGSALDVWPSYGRFEADMSILFDTVEAVYNSAKFVLEERARKVLGEAQDET